MNGEHRGKGGLGARVEGVRPAVHRVGGGRGGCGGGGGGGCTGQYHGGGV